MRRLKPAATKSFAFILKTSSKTQRLGRKHTADDVVIDALAALNTLLVEDDVILGGCCPIKAEGDTTLCLESGRGVSVGESVGLSLSCGFGVLDDEDSDRLDTGEGDELGIGVTAELLFIVLALFDIFGASFFNG